MFRMGLLAHAFFIPRFLMLFKEHYFSIEVENMTIALKIERYIKRMKSRVYIQNLIKYPEISMKLLEKYS